MQRNGKKGQTCKEMQSNERNAKTWEKRKEMKDMSTYQEMERNAKASKTCK